MSKYANYTLNLEVLKKAPDQDIDNEFVQSGIIDKFAMQFELAWKLLRKTLEHEGVKGFTLGSPRAVISAAYTAYDFIDEELWLAMLKDRNTSEHVYDSGLAKQLVDKILAQYISEFEALQSTLIDRYGEDLLETF